jgi:hypothetical protein
MISNTELKKQLKKDEMNLDDNQLNSIRSFLFQMATIEHTYYKKNKKDSRDCQSNLIIDISHKTNFSQLNKTA